jgi:hypothetical protein
MAKTKQGKKKAKNGKRKSKTGAAQQQQRAPQNPGSSNRRKIVGGKPSSMHNAMKNSKALHELVCSVTDPFCYKARLAKWPDGQGGGTLAMQVRGRQPLSPIGTSGGQWAQFTCDLPFSILVPASFAFPTWTLAANYSTVNMADFVTYTGAYRIVTAGIVIRNTAPATTSSGTVLIPKLSKQYPISSTPSQGLMVGSEVQEFPVYPGMEISCIFKTSGNTSRSFVPQNTSTTIVNGSNWETIQVELLNSSVANPAIALDIEYVYNVEIQLAPGSASLHEFVPPSAPHVPTVVTASSAVINKATTILEGGMKSAGEHILGKVEDFFSSAGTDLLAMLF